MRLEVFPKRLAVLFTCEEPWAAISISTDPGMWPALNESNRVDLLQLSFADIDLPRPGGMTTSDADAIIAFVTKNYPVVKCFMVHCEAGYSRSPAIAAFIKKVFGDGDESFFFQHYGPNLLVYNKLIKRYSELNPKFKEFI